MGLTRKEIAESLASVRDTGSLAAYLSELPDKPMKPESYGEGKMYVADFGACKVILLPKRVGFLGVNCA